MKFANITRGVILITALFLSLFRAENASAAITWLSSIAGQDAGVPMVAPSRLAVDGAGNIYVTESRNNKNRVLVFDRFGKYSRTLHEGISEPIGVAVDGQGRIYVGNNGTHSVDVFNPDLTPASLKIGKGQGEVQKPTAIAVTSTGVVYVVDLSSNVIKAYNADGKLSFTFGGSGSVDGKFSDPNGIAIDEARNEVYVTDRARFYNPTDGSNPGGPRVQVFTLSGVFVRSFWTYGASYENVGNLVGIAADGEGNLYIVDSKLQMVHVYKTTGQMSETITLTKLRTGLGLAIGKDKRMFIANSNSGTIEIYGLPGYTFMSVSSSKLDFSMVEGSIDPAAQTITIANSGSGALDWTASAATADGKAWLAASPSGSSVAGGTSTMTVSVKTAGLAAGIYTGSVTVTTLSGTQEKIAVNLTIMPPPAVLNVTPGSMAFKAQQGGPSPQPQSINITNTGGGTMTWNASTTAKWIALNVSSSAIEVVPNTALFTTAGTYTGQITIMANAQGSPAVVTVSVQVVAAGTVKVLSNISNAAFEITGASGPYSGTGTAWSNDEVKPGEYIITFKKVPGHLKPVSRKFAVTTGQEIVLSGDYRKRPVATHVIAGSADKDSRDQMIAVVPFDSEKQPVIFPAYSNADSVRIASGDLDASGFSTIVASDNRRSVKVFSEQGALLASYDLPDGFNNADVAVGDIDNDGKADILLGAENESKPHRVIKALTYSANNLQEKATLFSEDKEGGFSMAVGDVDDDGILEVLVADKSSVRAFSVQGTAGLAQLWVKNGDYGVRPQIAAGDLNGDGMFEVAVSYSRAKAGKGRGREIDQSSLISILKGSGEDFGLTIEPFKDLDYLKAATIVMGDTDGDGADEVVAGAGPAATNDPLIRVFENDGAYAGIIMKPMNGKFGVNVGLGTFLQ